LTLNEAARPHTLCTYSALLSGGQAFGFAYSPCWLRRDRAAPGLQGRGFPIRWAPVRSGTSWRISMAGPGSGVSGGYQFPCLPGCQG